MTQVDVAPDEIETEKVVESQPISSGEMIKAVKQAIKDEFAVTSWQKVEIKFTIDCPSGQRCLAKFLSANELVEADLVEDMDTFTKKLFPANIDEAGTLIEHEENTKEKFWDSLRDPKSRARFFRLTNKLMSNGVIRPEVIDDGVKIVRSKKTNKVKVILGCDNVTLQEGQVLASTVDFADRMAIFREYNRPLSQLNQFRDESNVMLPNLESI